MNFYHGRPPEQQQQRPPDLPPRVPVANSHLIIVDNEHNSSQDSGILSPAFASFSPSPYPTSFACNRNLATASPQTWKPVHPPPNAHPPLVQSNSLNVGGPPLPPRSQKNSPRIHQCPHKGGPRVRRMSLDQGQPRADYVFQPHNHRPQVAEESYQGRMAPTLPSDSPFLPPGFNANDPEYKFTSTRNFVWSQAPYSSSENSSNIGSLNNLQQQNPPPQPPPRDPRRRSCMGNYFSQSNNNSPQLSHGSSSINGYYNKGINSQNAIAAAKPSDLGVPLVKNQNRPYYSFNWDSPHSSAVQSPSFLNSSTDNQYINPPQNGTKDEDLSPQPTVVVPRRPNRGRSLEVMNRMMLKPGSSSLVRRGSSMNSGSSSHRPVSSISRDSAFVSSTGKASPSDSLTSSVESRDSGCPDTLKKPEKTKVEEKNSSNLKPVIEEVKMSPPRSDVNDPGFSTKKRRSLFRSAMIELEDNFAKIDSDLDLLDRAERRDLPTEHQELRFKKKESDESEDVTTRSITSSPSEFSDLDNVMNWNTSSSFENLNVNTSSRRTSRTPSSRRSAVYDKKNDDMVRRIIESNERRFSVSGPPPNFHGDMSYLSLSTSCLNGTVLDVTRNKVVNGSEPDILIDDLVNRSLRDTLTTKAQPDKQLPFGIPKEDKRIPASKSDYLHATPRLRYRSRFNAMSNPDVVRDDLAFRALRKDGLLNSDPSRLGVIPDPNARGRAVVAHSENVWLENRKRAEYEREIKEGPEVFYPPKDQRLLKEIAEDITRKAKASAHKPDAIPEIRIQTYQDLMREKDPSANPETLKKVKDSVEKIKASETEKWRGRNMYELLSAQMDEIIKGKITQLDLSKASDNKESEEEKEYVVNHCQIQYDDDRRKTSMKKTSMILDENCNEIPSDKKSMVSAQTTTTTDEDEVFETLSLKSSELVLKVEQELKHQKELQKQQQP